MYINVSSGYSFIIDFSGDIKSVCRLFAEEIELCNEADRAGFLQEDLLRLMKCSKAWKLDFSTDKCNVIHIGHGNIQSICKNV